MNDIRIAGKLKHLEWPMTGILYSQRGRDIPRERGVMPTSSSMHDIKRASWPQDKGYQKGN
jgi:hypothetical protein